MENVNAPKKRGPKPGTKYERKPSSSSEAEKPVVDLDRLIEAMISNFSTLRDKMSHVHRDMETLFVRYRVDTEDVADKLSERFTAPYVVILALVILTFLTSLGSCIQTTDNKVQDSLLPYPSKGQTCIVQDNTIAGCFADVE